MRFSHEIIRTVEEERAYRALARRGWGGSAMAMLRAAVVIATALALAVSFLYWLEGGWPGSALFHLARH
jgi:hypothetical protein